MARHIAAHAPIVSAHTRQGRVVNLQAGDVVTEDISDETVTHLESIGFIISTEDPEEIPISDDSPVDRPKSNDSKGKWLAYAATLGLEFEDDAALADIKESVKATESN